MKILVSPGKRFPTFLGPYEAALMGRLPCVSRLSPVCLPSVSRCLPLERWFLLVLGVFRRIYAYLHSVSTCVRRIWTHSTSGCQTYLMTSESLSVAKFYLEFRLKIALSEGQYELCHLWGSYKRTCISQCTCSVFWTTRPPIPWPLSRGAGFGALAMVRYHARIWRAGRRRCTITFAGIIMNHR